MFRAVVLGAVLLLASCGYQPVYATSATEKVCVRAAPPRIAQLGSVEAALEGARRELARANALGSDDEGPCLVIELLRVEETPTGIVAGTVDNREQPRARGSQTSVTGRGWIERTRGGPVSRDTGDMVRSSRSAGAATLTNEPGHHRSLVRAAAEELGRAIAQRILGLPAVSR